MPTPTDRARLLHDLTESRWEIMRWLADEAEERGDGWEAAGWRWMAERKKWPRAVPTRSGLNCYWESEPMPELDEEGDAWMNDLGLRPGPYLPDMGLPRIAWLRAFGPGRDKPFPTEREALEAAAKAVGLWLATAGDGSEKTPP